MSNIVGKISLSKLVVNYRLYVIVMVILVTALVGTFRGQFYFNCIASVSFLCKTPNAFSITPLAAR